MGNKVYSANQSSARELNNITLFRKRRPTTEIKYKYKQAIVAAEEFIREKLRLKKVDYSGLSLEWANLFNKTLIEEHNYCPFFERFQKIRPEYRREVRKNLMTLFF